MQGLTEENLGEEFLKNPELEFPKVYQRFSQSLFRFIYRFTENTEAAEEILHDIFIQLLNGKYRVQADGSLKAWLFTLAKNRSLDYLKQRRRESADEELVQETPSALNLEALLIDQNLSEKLKLAEKKLPQDLRNTWQLRKQGMNYQEIASTLQVPEGTVKSRFFRMVEILRKEFTDGQ